MKFTIQPFYESNPASVVNVPMDDEKELGRIEKPGTILVNKDITDHKKLANVINHENIHINQLKRGALSNSTLSAWDKFRILRLKAASCPSSQFTNSTGIEGSNSSSS